MKNFTESEIKYLAGLLDADGSLSFCYRNYPNGYKVHLQMSLCAAESTDKHGYLKSLSDVMGSFYIEKRKSKNENHADAFYWKLGSKKDFNRFLPRVLKHMVVKGKHWAFLYDRYLKLSGKNLTKEDVEHLKFLSKESRKNNTGPLKPKKHPTWAWVSGYLDGDGHYSKRYDKNPKKTTLLRVTLTAHENDYQGIDLLTKAFGGSNYKHKKKPWLVWHRNLGVTDHQFALGFLKKVHRHSRLKKHKIEQLLAFHNNHSQRLSEGNSTE